MSRDVVAERSRSTNIKVQLRENIKSDFQSYCDRYGISMSAMAALIIGTWVHSQKAVTEPCLENIVKAMSSSIPSCGFAGTDAVK